MTPFKYWILLAGVPASLATACDAGDLDERASGEACVGSVRAVVDPLTASVYQVPELIAHAEQDSSPKGGVELQVDSMGSMALATAPLQAIMVWKLLEKAAEPNVVGQIQRLVSHRPKFKGRSTDGVGMVKTPFLGCWAFCAMALTTAAAWRKFSQLRDHGPKRSRSSKRLVTLSLPEDSEIDIEMGPQQKSDTQGQKSPRMEWLMQEDQRKSIHEEEVLATTTPRTRDGREFASSRALKRHMTPSSSWFFSQYEAAPVTCEQHALGDGSTSPSELGSDDDDSDAAKEIQEHEDEVVLSSRSTSLFRIRSLNAMETFPVADDGSEDGLVPSSGRQPRVRIASDDSWRSTGETASPEAIP